MLTEEQRQKRYGKIGASFVPWLMAGNEDKIRREWMRLVEHPDYQEEDFSGDWVVAFGSYIEDFVLNWHANKTGQPLIHRGQWMTHPELRHIGCTLDAYRVIDKTVVDVKARIGFQPVDDIRAFYCAQLVVQKAVMRADNAALLIVHGGAEPREFEAMWDASYEEAVWERIAWFWQRVETLQPPCKLPSVKGSVPAVKSYDMQGSNAWAAAAVDWLQSKEAAQVFKAAEKGVKGLVPDDAIMAFGHGIAVSRSKAGSLTIKEART